MLNQLNKLEPIDGERFTWAFRRKSLREKMREEGGLDNCLSWPVSREALITGVTQFSTEEREMLRQRFARAAVAPNLGNPNVGSFPDGSNGTYVRQALVAQNIHDHIQPIANMSYIAEFGGGFGALAVVCNRLGFRGEYQIVDFPELAIIQEWYLNAMNINATLTEDVYSIKRPDVVVSVCSLDESSTQTRIDFMVHTIESRHIIVFNRGFMPPNEHDWFENWFDSNDIRFVVKRLPLPGQRMLITL
jgi:hypothetical protein